MARASVKALETRLPGRSRAVDPAIAAVSSLTMRAAEGFKDWLEWCEQENERNPGSQIRFSRTLTERGFRQKIDMRGSTYYGLSLLSDRPEAYRTPN
jgi:hypothetical protein